MTGSSSPRQCITASLVATTHVVYPCFYQVSLSESTHFGVQSFALSPCCLRLADTVANTHPRLAANDAATSYCTRFPPGKYHTFSWAHESLDYLFAAIVCSFLQQTESVFQTLPSQFHLRKNGYGRERIISCHTAIRGIVYGNAFYLITC